MYINRQQASARCYVALHSPCLKDYIVHSTIYSHVLINTLFSNMLHYTTCKICIVKKSKIAQMVEQVPCNFFTKGPEFKSQLGRVFL